MIDQSTCVGCGQIVSGRAGDPKVCVGHEHLVLCAHCFDCHPRRGEWVGYRPWEHRHVRRRMLVR
jgi:hypothetical protein